VIVGGANPALADSLRGAVDRSRAQVAPVVETRDLEKIYGWETWSARTARVSLSIAAGEFLAVMAPPLRKSTLMNLVGCLDRPTRAPIC